MKLSRLPQAARVPLETITGSQRPWGRVRAVRPQRAGHRQDHHRRPDSAALAPAPHQRDELWQVIDGPADVEVEGEASSVAAGGRAWIPRGSTHRLGNSGTAAVRVLEIAFGHFDEDDIERLMDDYDRVSAPALVHGEPLAE